jgi:hypothetical protein
MCAARIYAQRADEIQRAATAWKASGGQVLMVSLTVRHARGHSLSELRRGLAEAYRALWQGRGGERRRRAWGVAHSVRALEVTHGEHGWHPHLHVLVFTRGALPVGAEQDLAEDWSHAVARKLGTTCAPDLTHGADIRPIDDERYLAKLGLEISNIGSKKGRRRSRTPWELAHDAASGDGPSVGLWRQYSEAMKGARQLFWSRGARDFFGLGEDFEDEELAKDGGVGIVLAEWEGVEWDASARAFPFWTSLVAECASGPTPISSLKALPGNKSGRLAPGIVVCPSVAPPGTG